MELREFAGWLLHDYLEAAHLLCCTARTGCFAHLMKDLKQHLIGRLYAP